MKLISKSFAWALVLFLPLCPALAQTVTGAIRGIVTDSSGAIVARAAVTATNVATGVPTATKTNPAGEYSIRFLPVGTYRLVVEASGFKTATYGPFALEIDQTAKIDIPLSVGTGRVYRDRFGQRLSRSSTPKVRPSGKRSRKTRLIVSR